MVREIVTGQGYRALVDALDFERLGHLSWTAQVEEKEGYALVYLYRMETVSWDKTTKKQKRKKFYLHREITGCPKGFVVDHISGDTTDNRRANLRVCSYSQNRFNTEDAPGVSGFRGVWKQSKGKLSARPYSANITIDGVHIGLGSYALAAEAAWAYDQRAREHLGDFAIVNFPFLAEGENMDDADIPF